MSKKWMVTIVFLGLIALMMGVMVMIMLQPRPEVQVSAEPVNWDQLKVDPAVVQNGFNHYQLRCSKCHGHYGEGGYKGPSLIDDEWLYGNSLDQITAIISNGAPSGKMRGWKHTLRSEDIHAISVYVSYLDDPDALKQWVDHPQKGQD